MSVACIDFGNDSCYVSLARKGVIDTHIYKCGNREMPSCVAFTRNNRLIGVVAQNQQNLNSQNTLYGFKCLLGKKFDDVKNYAEKLNFKIRKKRSGSIGFVLQYLNIDKLCLIPEQVVAMLYSEIISEIGYGKTDFILTVPSYFTSSERQAILDAAKIANLNCLELMNETTAIALDYGYYRQADFNRLISKEVAFIDFGHSSLQVSIVAFTKGKIEVLANTSTMIGGRDFDLKLCDYYCEEIKKKYNVNPQEDRMAYARLLIEVEKFKKLMSINSTNLIFKMENFMNLLKIDTIICRKEMEMICHKLFVTLEETIRRCIKRSKKEIGDIHSIEITGGSSRIPEFLKLTERIFGKTPNTTLNRDEAISHGGAIYCAMRSTCIKLNYEIEIVDVLSDRPLQVTFSYDEKHVHKAVIFEEVAVFPLTINEEFSLPGKNLFNRISFNCLEGPQSLDIWKLNWTEDQIEIFFESEKKFVTLTLNIDKNGVLSLIKVEMEFHEYIKEIDPLDVVKKITQFDHQADFDASDFGMNYESTDTLKLKHTNQKETASQRNAGFFGFFKRFFRRSDKTKHGNETQETRNPLPVQCPVVGNPSSAVTASTKLGIISTENLKPKDTTRILKTTSDISFHLKTSSTLSKLSSYQKLEIEMKGVNLSEDQRNEARNYLEELVYEIRENITIDDTNNINATQFSEFLDFVEEWIYNHGENCKRETYLQLHKEIMDFNMIEKVRNIDEETEYDFDMLKAKIRSIMQL